MTLQQPIDFGFFCPKSILCHKCGAPIVFDKNHISPTTKRKIPLDPYFNNEPHAQHCMYFTASSKPELDLLFKDFLSLVPNKRPRRIIGAVGKAK
ncbi:MAG: hypothetical protein ACRD8W_03410 [Nitrososphaeraceae archaeon]